MDYGEIFARLMARAIEKEESDLARLKAEAPNSPLSEDTVRIYGEYWIWPAFLKEAWRDPECPKIEWEKRGIDCSFFNGEEALARFELKPFSLCQFVR